MSVKFQVLVALMILCGCSRETKTANKWSVKGSWYNAEPWSKLRPEIAYYELYFDDSVMCSQDEFVGQVYERSYQIKGDSLFIENIAYKLEEQRGDTLFLTPNPKTYTANTVTRKHWIRLPPGELGYYELLERRGDDDSLKWKVVFDFERRTYLYEARIANRMDLYDSLVRVGRFDWNMKLPIVQERLGRDSIRRQHDLNK